MRPASSGLGVCRGCSAGRRHGASQLTEAALRAERSRSYDPRWPAYKARSAENPLADTPLPRIVPATAALRAERAFVALARAR